MRVLVLGGSGATGKEVVRQLVEKNVAVRIVVREGSKLPADILENSSVEILRGSISAYSLKEIKELLQDCDAAVSCLGHNLTFKGIYGHPRTLVHDAVQNVYSAIEQNAQKGMKLVLMSTTGYNNEQNGEKRSVGESIVSGLLYSLLPPHRDNMLAGNFLTKQVGANNPSLEWIAVRPDGLIDSDTVSAYDLKPSPVRSPIFDAGKTSRINVANFMAKLLTDDTLWQQWKYQTPVIYNREQA